MLGAYDYFPYGKILRKFVGGNGIERYLTTQHERDEETISNNTDGTGLDYRFARLSDSDIGRFTSIDPHDFDYPSMSPYSYVGGNPIMFIDPDGKNFDNYQVTGDGGIKLIEETDDDFDVLFNEDNSESTKVNDKSILPELTKGKTSAYGYGMHSAETNSRSDAFNVFLFVANNSNVEWAIGGYNYGGKDSYTIATYNVNYRAPGAYSTGNDISNQFVNIHSHAKFNDSYGASTGDKSLINSYREQGSSAYYGVYEKQNQSLYHYNSKGSSFIRRIGTDPKRFSFGGF